MIRRCEVCNKIIINFGLFGGRRFCFPHWLANIRKDGKAVDE